jgi:hypothetical protein
MAVKKPSLRHSFVLNRDSNKIFLITGIKKHPGNLVNLVKIPVQDKIKIAEVQHGHLFHQI